MKEAIVLFPKVFFCFTLQIISLFLKFQLKMIVNNK